MLNTLAFVSSGSKPRRWQVEGTVSAWVIDCEFLDQQGRSLSSTALWQPRELSKQTTPQEELSCLPWDAISLSTWPLHWKKISLNYWGYGNRITWKVMATGQPALELSRWTDRKPTRDCITCANVGKQIYPQRSAPQYCTKIRPLLEYA